MDDKQFGISNLEIKKIFDLTVEKCNHSPTQERSLLPDLSKEELLIMLRYKNKKIYGTSITSQFQASYKTKNPELLFLFTQISSFILEKTFHDGTCSLQTNIALFELCKKGILNASLVYSRTGNPSTEYFYLLLFDEFTFKALEKKPSCNTTSFILNSNDFKKEWGFFAPWSNQLCQWKSFKPQNSFTKTIQNTPQVIFKPLVHLFKNEINLLENIIWCLTEYEKYLKSLMHCEEENSTEFTKSFTPSEDKPQKEGGFLFNSEECILQLLKSIEVEKNEFQERLTVIKQADKKSVGEANINEKDIRLRGITSAFFQEKVPAKWKIHPQNNTVRFFTLPRNDIATQQQARNLSHHLKEKGIPAELTVAKVSGNPSIILDLEKSSFTM